MTGAVTRFGPLVATDWLQRHLHDSDLILLDARWYLPASGKDGAREYRQAHIPGAIFFDIDLIADRTSHLPHTMPDATGFADAAGAMGIGRGIRVVVYDGPGGCSAARVWWMLRYFGHGDVAVLDGGLGKWACEERAMVDTPPAIAPRNFTARVASEQLASLADVRANLDTGAAQLVDARKASRFHAKEPEPREGVRSGHIPGARNIPYTDLLDPERHTFLTPDLLRARFAGAGVDVTAPMIFTCGSGVSACVIALAATILQATNWSVYDGSWCEWGARHDLPIAR